MNELCLSILLFSTIIISSRAQESNRPPNVVFILSDDLGYEDLACYGHPYAETPNIDRIAKEGTRFMNFHVTGGICGPSRTGFMTGRNPTSFPNYTHTYGFMGVKTIASILRDAGYKTGHFGKWHIGDRIDGRPGGLHTKVQDGTYGLDTIVNGVGMRSSSDEGKDAKFFDAAIDFMTENKDQPFYVNIWASTPHAPIVPPKKILQGFKHFEVDRNRFSSEMVSRFEFLEKRRKKNINNFLRRYLADIFALDAQVGKILNHLDNLQISEDTIVVFTSDNGPEIIGNAGELRGIKHSFFEGGVRVPFIVRWPGKVPANFINQSSLIGGQDWLTTITSLANVPINPEMYDGEDMSDVFLGSCRSRTNPLFWGLPYKANSRKAMMYGKWKFYPDMNQLYDLETDLGEKHNLVREFPDIAYSFRQSVRSWKESLPKKVSTGKNKVPIQPFDPLEKPVVIGPPSNVNIKQSEVCYFEGEEYTPPPSIAPSASPTKTLVPTRGNCSSNVLFALTTQQKVSHSQQTFCVDFLSDEAYDGVRIVFKNCNDSRNQQWTMDCAGYIRNGNYDDMCIVPKGFENAHGVDLVLSKCGTNKLNFRWQMNGDNTISYGAGGGTSYVMNVAGTRPLFDGIGINLSKYYGWKRQHWKHVLIDEEGLETLPMDR